MQGLFTPGRMPGKAGMNGGSRQLAVGSRAVGMKMNASTGMAYVN